jgi:two-component system chemotaxis response regulator CheY
MQVLIVDDQQSMRELLRHCLKEIGVTKVTSTKSAEDALETVTRESYDLVISDWNMDGMTGLDLLKNIRSNPVIKGLPFIMATGTQDKKQVMAAKEAGANNYIVKPFSTGDLRKRVEAVFGALS